MSLGNDAFNSGIANVFLKRTLEKLGRGGEFRKVSSAISGNVALTSIVFIVLLPYLTIVDIHLPLIVGLFLDIIGLITVLSLADMHVHSERREKIGFLSLIQRAR